MKTIIFDTETTGLPAQPIERYGKIIEFGAIMIDDRGVIIRTVNQLLNPGEFYDKKLNHFTTHVPAKSTELTGIVDEDLVGQPTFTEFLPFLHHFFEGADRLIAHNAKFDVGMLKTSLELQENPLYEAAEFPWPAETFCTMLEYTPMNGGRWPKLKVLYEKIMGKPLAQTHRALDDVMAVYEILKKEGYFDPAKTQD